MKMAESSPTGVENTVGKGEIARYEQFLLFPQSFQKTCTADTYKPGFVWERVIYTLNCLKPFAIQPCKFKHSNEAGLSKTLWKC